MTTKIITEHGTETPEEFIARCRAETAEIESSLKRQLKVLYRSGWRTRPVALYQEWDLGEIAELTGGEDV